MFSPYLSPAPLDWKEGTFGVWPARQGGGRTWQTRDNAIVLHAESSASTLSMSRFIEDVSVVAPVAGRPFEVDQLPDGRTSLVFRVFEEGREGDVAVVGPRTRAACKNGTGGARAGGGGVQERDWRGTGRCRALQTRLVELVTGRHC